MSEQMPERIADAEEFAWQQYERSKHHAIKRTAHQYETVQGMAQAQLARDVVIAKQAKLEVLEELAGEWEKAYSEEFFPYLDMREVEDHETTRVAERNAANLMRHWAGVLRRRVAELEGGDAVENDGTDYEALYSDYPETTGPAGQKHDVSEPAAPLCKHCGQDEMVHNLGIDPATNEPLSPPVYFAMSEGGILFVCPGYEPEGER